MKAESAGSLPEQAAHGIDRMVRNVETGRFERGLSALTAAAAGAAARIRCRAARALVLPGDLAAHWPCCSRQIAVICRKTLMAPGSPSSA